MEIKDQYIIAAAVSCVVLLAVNIIGHVIKRERNRRKQLEILKIKGEEGERESACHLLKVRGRKNLISNIYIPGFSGSGNQHTTEIDMVMIHEKGIFVIENKNYSGLIYGTEEDATWLQIKGDRKKRYFYSPVRQNQNHIKYLKKLLEPLLDEDVPVISVIIFNQHARLKKIRIHSGTIMVCSSDKVRQRINRYLWLRRKKMKQEQIREISGILESYANVTKKVKREHIRNLKHYKTL